MPANKKWIVYAAVVWTLIFTAMSVYWALGGMIGVESLGGAIYEKALDRDPSFIPLVWATAVAKLLGAVFLLLLLKRKLSAKRTKIIKVLCAAAGIFMILYGVGNFITVSLAGLHVLQFDLSAYALKWRLIFWEPFWVVGGIFYLLSGLGSRNNV